jgi:hypothetical protein
MGPCNGVDYNLTLCPFQSRFQHIYSTMGNPIPESTLTLCQSRLYSPVRGFGFGLWAPKLLKNVQKSKLLTVYTEASKLKSPA